MGWEGELRMKKKGVRWGRCEYSEERRMWKQTTPKKQETQTQERERGSSGFKTTVLTLNQPHSGMFWALMFFMDYRLFQTLNKDSSRQASFPSCPCFSYSSPNSLLPLVSQRVRADLPGTRLKASLVHCKFWWLSLWCLHGGLTRGSEPEKHMMELGYSFASSRHLSVHRGKPNPPAHHSWRSRSSWNIGIPNWGKSWRSPSKCNFW